MRSGGIRKLAYKRKTFFDISFCYLKTTIHSHPRNGDKQCGGKEEINDVLERSPLKEDFKSAERVIPQLPDSQGLNLALSVDGFQIDVLQQRICCGLVHAKLVQLKHDILGVGCVAANEESALLMVQRVELEAEGTPNGDDQLLAVENLVPVDDKQPA